MMLDTWWSAATRINSLANKKARRTTLCRPYSCLEDCLKIGWLLGCLHPNTIDADSPTHLICKTRFPDWVAGRGCWNVPHGTTSVPRFHRGMHPVWHKSHNESTNCWWLATVSTQAFLVTFGIVDDWLYHTDMRSEAAVCELHCNS